jgi:hypothetical protein
MGGIQPEAGYGADGIGKKIGGFESRSKAGNDFHDDVSPESGTQMGPEYSFPMISSIQKTRDEMY